MNDMQRRAREHDASMPTVTVIIPTFNDVGRLATCLWLLSQQDYPADLFEVIVVDNASTEDLRPALPDDPRFRLLHESKRGSYAARNTAVAHARGEILAFTDSDCLPRLDWLSQGVKALTATPAPDVIGGPIPMVFQDGKAARSAPEIYDAMEGFPQERFIQVYPFAATANLMVRRDTFNTVGPFNSDLASGGDREWGVRLAATGRTFAYAPAAVVDHPSRATWGELTRKSVRVGKGMAELIRTDSREEVINALKTETKGTWQIWRQVWEQPDPPGRRAKVKYAAAFAYVRAIRSSIMATSFVRRELGARRRNADVSGGPG